LASPGHVSIRPPGVRSPFGDHAIPGLAYGLATRARRPRPSEKTPSASSPTFPRTAIHAGLVPPGGAGSARPEGRPGPHRGISLSGPGPLAWPSRLMKCLGKGTAFRCGRTECAPPRKSASGESGLYPFSQCPFGKPPAEGRAPHAHKDTIGFPRACLHYATERALTFR